MHVTRYSVFFPIPNDTVSYKGETYKVIESDWYKNELVIELNGKRITINRKDIES